MTAAEPSVPSRPADLDPQAIFTEVVAAHREAMTDLAALAREADNDSARVGAIKARTAAGAQLVGLLASVGLMPDPARVLLARAQAIHARAWRVSRRGAARGWAVTVRPLDLPEDDPSARFPLAVAASLARRLGLDMSSLLAPCRDVASGISSGSCRGLAGIANC